MQIRSETKGNTLQCPSAYLRDFTPLPKGTPRSVVLRAFRDVLSDPERYAYVTETMDNNDPAFTQADDLRALNKAIKVAEANEAAPSTRLTLLQ